MRINFSINIDDRIIAGLRKVFQLRNVKIAALLLFLSASIAYSIDVEYVFNKGDIIDADKINENFKKIYDEVGLLADTSVDSLERRISNLNSEFANRYKKISDYIDQLTKGSIPGGLIAMYNPKEYDCPCEEGDSDPNCLDKPENKYCIPEGWVICDGAEGSDTPDLRGKFVIGAEFTEGSIYNPQECEDQKCFDSPVHKHSYKHGHKGTTDTGGGHSHEWLKWEGDGAGDATCGWYYNKNSDNTYNEDYFVPKQIINSGSPGDPSDDFYPFGLGMDADFDTDIIFKTDTDDGHEHTVPLQALENAETDSISGGVECIPPYHALIYIMRKF